LCLFGSCAPPPVELASFTGRGRAIATSEEHVWVIVEGEQVHRVSKTGAASELIATLTPATAYANNAIATDDTHAYWADGYEIQRVPLVGGNVETVVNKDEDGAWWMDIYEDSVLWWDRDRVSSSGSGILYQAPKTGGDPSWLMTATDDWNFTALSRHDSLMAYGIVRDYTYGAATRDFVASEAQDCSAYETDEVEAVASNGDDVWWIVDDMIRHWNMFGGREDFAKLPGHGHRLVLAGDDLVWSLTMAGSGMIGKTSTTTRISSALAVTSTDLVEPMTVDDGSVYWTNNEGSNATVMKIAIAQ
jgi:hypothetical protein